MPRHDMKARRNVPTNDGLQLQAAAAVALAPLPIGIKGGSGSGSNNKRSGGTSSSYNSSKKSKCGQSLLLLLLLPVAWCIFAVSSRTGLQQQHIITTSSSPVVVTTTTNAAAAAAASNTGQRGTTERETAKKLLLTMPAAAAAAASSSVPEGFHTVLERALQHTDHCKSLQAADDVRGFDTRAVLPFHNDTVASLPSFGVVHAIQSYFSKARTNENNKNNENDNDWPVCHMPPVEECKETQLTVVFMAYNPDRLGITMQQIRKMLDPVAFFHLVKEIVLVWNGERHIDESKHGVDLLQYAKDHPVLRIAYPLKMGFPNDLMNRYHPAVVQPTTRALLYYDDDGPFYSYEAVQAGFELWKRHPTAQIGAMARQITYSARQQEQHVQLVGRAETKKKSAPADDQFVSHCTNAAVDDQVDYNFRFFANYDANMVLPSGSMLHANYLCYLWHPVFAEIRQFVLDHPVHPDDMTVSMIVSQLAGVAPRVYSRRLEKTSRKKQQRRRLSEPDGGSGDVSSAYYYHDKNENGGDGDDDHTEDEEEPVDWGIVPLSERQRQRSLMFSICWDCGAGMTEMKQYWAELRTEAVNSLVRYFGSLNSGSIGWCTRDSPYYDATKDGRCEPNMAKQGWLPWMNQDGTPKETCP